MLPAACYFSEFNLREKLLNCNFIHFWICSWDYNYCIMAVLSFQDGFFHLFPWSLSFVQKWQAIMNNNSRTNRSSIIIHVVGADSASLGKTPENLTNGWQVAPAKKIYMSH